MIAADGLIGQKKMMRTFFLRGVDDITWKSDLVEEGD